MCGSRSDHWSKGWLLGGASELGVEGCWWQPSWENGGVLTPGDRNVGDLLRRGNTMGCRRRCEARVEWDPCIEDFECLSNVPSIFQTLVRNQKKTSQ